MEPQPIFTSQISYLLFFFCSVRTVVGNVVFRMDSGVWLGFAHIDGCWVNGADMSALSAVQLLPLQTEQQAVLFGFLNLRVQNCG